MPAAGSVQQVHPVSPRAWGCWVQHDRGQQVQPGGAAPHEDAGPQVLGAESADGSGGARALRHPASAAGSRAATPARPMPQGHTGHAQHAQHALLMGTWCRSDVSPLPRPLLRAPAEGGQAEAGPALHRHAGSQQAHRVCGQRPAGSQLLSSRVLRNAQGAVHGSQHGRARSVWEDGGSLLTRRQQAAASLSCSLWCPPPPPP